MHSQRHVAQFRKLALTQKDWVCKREGNGSSYSPAQFGCNLPALPPGGQVEEGPLKLACHLGNPGGLWKLCLLNQDPHFTDAEAG